MTMRTPDSLQPTLKRVYRRLLRMHYKANCGHIGGNISCLDAMLTLHHLVMQEQDRFILSKGHAAGALYATLWSLGRLSDAELDSFCCDGTALAGHPSSKGIPGLLFATGSLGHGPSLAAGLALAGRAKGADHAVYCLCSDGEWQEGSCWEALIFAVHQRLERLTLLIDVNGLQGFGTTSEVASFDDLAPRFESFGTSVALADGHDPAAIIQALGKRGPEKPHVVLLETCKGRGLCFEGKLESHYLPLSREEYFECGAADEDGCQP